MYVETESLKDKGRIKRSLLCIFRPREPNTLLQFFSQETAELLELGDALSGPFGRSTNSSSLHFY